MYEPLMDHDYKKHSHLLMKMYEPLMNYDYKKTQSLVDEDE